MKGKRLTAALLLALGAASCFGYVALGAQGGYSAAQEGFGFASVTATTDGSPWVFSLDWGWEDAHLAFNADDWFVHHWIAYPLAFFVFWGISGDVQLEGDFHATTGARVGIGADVFLFRKRNVELYAQGAWNPCIGVEVDDGDDVGLLFLPLCFPVSAGVRFWFK